MMVQLQIVLHGLNLRQLRAFWMRERATSRPSAPVFRGKNPLYNPLISAKYTIRALSTQRLTKTYSPISLEKLNRVGGQINKKLFWPCEPSSYGYRAHHPDGLSWSHKRSRSNWTNAPITRPLVYHLGESGSTMAQS